MKQETVSMRRVPLLDLRAQYATIRDEVRAAIDRVVEAQAFILGPEVAAFEDEVAAYTGAGHAIGVSSGTDALLAALMAANVGVGDEVITTPYSFFATAGTIVRLGAVPVFVDIDPVTYNMRADLAAERVGPRTKAIMPVHLYGRVASMDPLLAAAADAGIPLIEDAAQAIGARDTIGRAAGTIGAIGCFSFFPSKNLGGFGDGGMVTTGDEELAGELRALRMHGASVKYFHDRVGGNFRLDALQAAVLRVKLPYLDGWTAARRRNADLYRSLIAEAGLGQALGVPEDEPGHIYNQFVIRSSRRDELRAFLTDRGVGNEIYYPVPLHRQACFAYLGHAAGEFPVAEAAARETLALPIYPELTNDDIRYVVTVIAEFLGR